MATLFQITLAFAGIGEEARVGYRLAPCNCRRASFALGANTDGVFASRNDLCEGTCKITLYLVRCRFTGSSAGCRDTPRVVWKAVVPPGRKALAVKAVARRKAVALRNCPAGDCHTRHADCDKYLQSRDPLHISLLSHLADQRSRTCRKQRPVIDSLQSDKLKKYTKSRTNRKSKVSLGNLCPRSGLTESTPARGRTSSPVQNHRIAGQCQKRRGRNHEWCGNTTLRRYARKEPKRQ